MTLRTETELLDELSNLREELAAVQLDVDRRRSERRRTKRAEQAIAKLLLRHAELQAELDSARLRERFGVDAAALRVLDVAERLHGLNVRVRETQVHRSLQLVHPEHASVSTTYVAGKLEELVDAAQLRRRREPGRHPDYVPTTLGRETLAAFRDTEHAEAS